MHHRYLEVRRLGRVGYAKALELQKELETDVIAKRERDYLLLLEHPHTFTLGRRSKTDGVLATAEMLRTLGVEVFETNRGGRVTYHGIGQIVGYLNKTFGNFIGIVSGCLLKLAPLFGILFYE